MTPEADNGAPSPRAHQRHPLASLSRRLDREALDQLRTVAADQAMRIEVLQAQVDELQQSLYDMGDCAEGWRSDAIRAIKQLAEARGGRVALVQTGQLVVVPEPTAQVSA